MLLVNLGRLSYANRKRLGKIRKFIKKIMKPFNRAFGLLLINIKMACRKIISFVPFYPKFEKNLKTPYLGLYYPLKSAIVSVNLRFMGVFLILFILFFIILFFANYIFSFDSPNYFINIFGALTLFSLFKHVLSSIKHLLLTLEEYIDLLDDKVIDKTYAKYNYMHARYIYMVKIFYERKYDEKLRKFRNDVINYLHQKIW